MSSLAFFRNDANRKSLMPVAVAQLSLPGWARACATSSASDPTFMAAGATMATMVLDTRAIGARSASS